MALAAFGGRHGGGHGAGETDTPWPNLGTTRVLAGADGLGRGGGSWHRGSAGSEQGGTHSTHRRQPGNRNPMICIERRRVVGCVESRE